MTEETGIKRVTFVGAGFSKWAGFPLGGELVNSLGRYVKGELLWNGKGSELKNSLRKSRADDEDRRQLVNDLETFVGTYFGKDRVPSLFLDSPSEPIDLNEFYSIADALSETPNLFAQTKSDTPANEAEMRLASLYPRIASATRTYFNDLFDGSPDQPADVQSIFDAVDHTSHAFVNFNWDEILDFEFSVGADGSRNREICYTLEAWKNGDKDQKNYLLLKPHGSANWYDVAQGIDNKYKFYIADNDRRIPKEKKRIISYYEVEQPVMIAERRKRHPRLHCPPVITPPTLGKRFSYLEQQLIWRDVIDVCREATEFVFLGYRIGRDDYLTRATIRLAQNSGLNKKIKALAVMPWTSPWPKEEAQLVESERETLVAFRSVFGKAFGECNVLDWELGNSKHEDPASLARIITERLDDAVISKSSSNSHRSA